jgi:hypothetical protein
MPRLELATVREPVVVPELAEVAPEEFAPPLEVEFALELPVVSALAPHNWASPTGVDDEQAAANVSAVERRVRRGVRIGNLPERDRWTWNAGAGAPGTGGPVANGHRGRNASTNLLPASVALGNATSMHLVMRRSPICKPHIIQKRIVQVVAKLWAARPHEFDVAVFFWRFRAHAGVGSRHTRGNR